MKESILYQTDLIEIGLFAVDPNEPCFIERGYVADPIIVFPKNSIWIQHEGSTPFVADSTLVNFYNGGQSYLRSAINPSGDYCHWFRISDEVLSEVVAKEQRPFTCENMLCPAEVFLQHLQLLHDISVPVTNDELAIEERVLQLFHTLLTQANDARTLTAQTKSRHKLLVESVKESLQADLSVNLSLPQL